MFKTLLARRYGELLALLSGAALTLAFAPFHYSLLAILSPACLLALWLPVSRRRAALRGLLFGLGLFGSGVSWVFISIHQYGNTDIFTAGLITALFVFILSLYPCLHAWLYKTWFKHSDTLSILLAYPATWVLCEWLRGTLFTGFPWLLLGYAQLNSPLRGWAPLLSVYGCSLISVWLAALLVFLCQKNHSHRSRYLGIAAILLSLMVSQGLSQHTWAHADKAPLRASLIQGNIPQEIKWQEKHSEDILQRHQKLSASHWTSDLVIWPEAAITIPLPYSRHFLGTMAQLAKRHHSTLITGIPIWDANKKRYTNAVVARGQYQGEYAKRHLVPFGDYLPFDHALRGLIHFFNLPMSSFSPGAMVQPPLQLGKTRMATFICYEIAFPGLVLSSARQANILLNVSNDTWFGHSIGPKQHLDIARMRALETGRPLLRSTNNGITAFIGPDGHIRQQAPSFTATVLTHLVQPTSGQTPLLRYGIVPLLATLLILTLVLVWRARKRQPPCKKWKNALP